MEDSKHTFVSPNVFEEKKQPVVLITQLMQSIAQMRHVDEAFVWLSNALVRSFGLPVVQLWKTEMDNTGQFHADLRALTTLDGSLPQEAYLNKQIFFTTERVFHSKKSVRSMPVQGIFPPLQASLCTRHGLHYWAGFFLDSNTLFSSSGTISKPAAIPLTVVVSLFTEVPLSGYQVRAMSFVLKQTMRIIINRRFQTFQNSFRIVQRDPDEDAYMALAAIIPTRLQDLQQFQAVNPFAHASIIESKRARRVYSAIDGYRNITELARITFLGREELIEALRYLFQQQKIEFYTPGGEHVKHLPSVLYAS